MTLGSRTTSIDLWHELRNIGSFTPGEEVVALRVRKKGEPAPVSHVPAVVGAVFIPPERLSRRAPVDSLLQLFTLTPAGVEAVTITESDIKRGAVSLSGVSKFSSTYRQIKQNVVEEYQVAPVQLMTKMVASLAGSALSPKNNYHKKYGCNETLGQALEGLTVLATGERPSVVPFSLVHEANEALKVADDKNPSRQPHSLVIKRHKPSSPIGS